jgi:hypothetical protein
MADLKPNYSTPSAVRSVTSYPARRGFKQAVDPALDYVVGVEDAIDIHCHAHEGQQDALGVAKLASKSGMKGILYKTIVGRKDPAGTVGGVRRALEFWCEEKGLTPAHLWPGSSVTQGFLSKIEPAWSAKMLNAGVIALWMPNNTSANTLSIVGGKPIAWDKTADRMPIRNRYRGPNRSNTATTCSMTTGGSYLRSKRSSA